MHATAMVRAVLSQSKLWWVAPWRKKILGGLRGSDYTANLIA
ncbi:MAG TPA: hypothetical protein VMV52_00025 [Candidatus Nanopelagicaceae bacterium]|nr:hypothetical protein [Candidatus Nanopelagicaceae bacterium]